MKSTLAAALGLLLAAGTLPAQAPSRGAPGAPPPAGNGEIKGTIVDLKSSAPVARASVSVRTKSSGALVAGALAGPNGAFRVQGLRPGAYAVRITFLGFAPKMQDVAIAPDKPVVDLGTVQLDRAVVTLGSVDVVEKQDAVTIEPDRNSYRAKDVAPAATNASQVLEATPAVTVDADGKVSLRGNENVAIQINGRPAPISARSSARTSRACPPVMLDRVEVVPNPSAKYDPEGMAGIINIVLKQNVDLGISGGLTVGAANKDRYNTSGNFGYQVGQAHDLLQPRHLQRRPERHRHQQPPALRRVNTLLSSTEQDIDGSNGSRGRTSAPTSTTS